MTERVAVVGGGAVGVTAAHDLAARGADVTLYERGDLASGASGRAAGIAYDAFAEDRDATVAARALERFRNLDDTGAVPFTPCPYVWLAREGDDDATGAIREQVPRMRSHGRNVDLLDAGELAERFPTLEAGDVSLAAVARDAGVLDPPSYVTAMADSARESGVAVRTDTRVALAGDGTVVRTAAGKNRFDAVLVAAGAHSARLLEAVGHAIAMKPYRVQALVTAPVDVGAGAETPVPSVFDATEMCYFRPREGGLLAGDGTEEREFDPDYYDETADESFRERSLDRVAHRFSVDADDVRVDRSWAGLCTATPDRDPLLGPVDGARRVFVATGWQGHGFMRAPALGETAAEQVLGGDGVDAFDPRRFDGDETFQILEGMSVEDE